MVRVYTCFLKTNTELYETDPTQASTVSCNVHKQAIQIYTNLVSYWINSVHAFPYLIHSH